MINLKSIFTLFISIFTLVTFSQDNTRLEQIYSVSELAIENCDGEKYGIDEEETKKNLSLYQEYYKQKAFDDALPYWRNVFFSAPKSSQNLYIRGTSMYKKLAKANEGETKERFIDTLLAISETRIECFGSAMKYKKTKAFDWYTYRRKGNASFVLEMFENTFQDYKKDSLVPPATFLVYWFDITMRANKTDSVVDNDSALVIYTKVSEIIEEQLLGINAGKYEGARLKINELIKAYNFEIDCEQVLPMIEKSYRENPNDTLTILKTYKKLKSFSCTDKAFFMEIVDQVILIKPSYQICYFGAKKAKDAGDNTKALKYFSLALKYTDDNANKEKILLIMARIYYNIGNFIKVRQLANQVLSFNPNSGKSYLIIGRTYASSGKICGTGTDFKSHTIVWAAVDTWKKAIRVDETVKTEAQSLVNKYSQYMPTKEELFMVGVSIGSTYNISCFGFTTIVRSSD